MDAHPFVPYPFLENAHLMTVVAAVWLRRFKIAEGGERRLFAVDKDSKILAICHWQSDRNRCPTVIVLHGMEGSSESHNVLGLSEKAFACGMNVVRMNMRNCADTTDLTPTLYNAGLSGDLLAVIRELKQKDNLDNLIVVAWSLGGNVALKAAAELGDEGTGLITCMSVISPAIDLALCVETLREGFNRFYEDRFLGSLKNRLLIKSKLFPNIYDPKPLAEIKTVRQFDETYTAPLGGYGTADNYYKTCSSMYMLDKIRIPTLIIEAKDDPLVPYSAFTSDQLNNPHITLLAPEHGGHGGFLQRHAEQPALFDRFWAENRVVTFCAKYNQSVALPQS